MFLLPSISALSTAFSGSPMIKREPPATTPVEGLRRPTDEDSPTDSRLGSPPSARIVCKKMSQFSTEATLGQTKIQFELSILMRYISILQGQSVSMTENGSKICQGTREWPICLLKKIGEAW